MIRHEGTWWVLYSRDGTKVLGRFKTKREADKREGQVLYYKRKGAKRWQR